MYLLYFLQLLESGSTFVAVPILVSLVSRGMKDSVSWEQALTIFSWNTVHATAKTDVTRVQILEEVGFLG